jgi:hypothetical protein
MSDDDKGDDQRGEEPKAPNPAKRVKGSVPPKVRDRGDRTTEGGGKS